jgi:hypothetical protein|tara:strand:- start:201 stop:401 length:201 start_codon:yes stop_codon:yes gene_type:complete
MIPEGIKASVTTSKAVTPRLGSGRRTPKTLSAINKENDYAAKIRKKYDKANEIRKNNDRYNSKDFV